MLGVVMVTCWKSQSKTSKVCDCWIVVDLVPALGPHDLSLHLEGTCQRVVGATKLLTAWVLLDLSPATMIITVLGFHQGFNMPVNFWRGLLDGRSRISKCIWNQVRNKDACRSRKSTDLYGMSGFCVQFSTATVSYLHLKKRKYHFKLLLKLSGDLPEWLREMTEHICSFNMSCQDNILGYVMINGTGNNGPINQMTLSTR